MLPLLPLCLSSTSISGWSLHNPHIICHRKSSNIMSNNHPVPALISLPRIRTLVASLFVMLGSGTNYVSKDFFDHFITQMWILLGVFRWGSALAAFVEGEYDQKNNLLTLFLCVAYSPQLGTRLKISHTQLNMVALAGNGAEFRAFQQPTWRFFLVGGYSFCTIWGRIVDSHGPRIPLAFSFICLLGGYGGIKYFYDSGLAPDALSAPAIIFYALLLCSFLTGVGSAGGSTSAIFSTTKTFPDRAVCIHTFSDVFAKLFYSLLHDSEHLRSVW